MTREDSIRQIENYPPFNEQEEKDKALILGWISNNENAFSRENTVAHITASAWVVNKDRSKVLMVYHNIYNFNDFILYSLFFFAIIVLL